MAKKVRAIISLIVVFAVMLPCVLFTGVYVETASADEDFAFALSSIYAKYDKNISKLNPLDEYALSRVMVSGWNNKNYGASDVAYDRENDFAVLQYKSPEKAKKAAGLMKADGLIAEADSICTLESDGKCTLSPQYSSALGVDSYLDNFNMEADDVIVAVIDTGVMYDHEALDGRMYSTGVDYSGDNMTDAYYDTEERGDHYAHGTFVCSVIADNTPDSVKLLPIKAVTFDNEETPASALITGINYAVREGASVINVSLATYYGQSNFEVAVNNALSNGACICASAGNDAEMLENRYPGCIDGVITVTALNADCNAPASFTNYGAEVDFCAPGTRIHGAYPIGGESTYRNWSGTSFSSPYIAALCADIKSAECEISKDGVYQTLCDFAHDFGTAGRDDYCGNGMPDIGNITYSSSGEYDYSIPQGVLNVYSSPDYTAETQPWRLFARKMKQVNISRSINTVGDYAFYNMQSASFTLPQNFLSVGDYSFYNCKKLKKAIFTAQNTGVGYKAFDGIENFTIRGYLNTPAHTYALNEKVRFVKLGCNHNWFYETFEPSGNDDGYTLYTCSVCGETYTGEYIQPNVLKSGSCGDSLTYTLYDTGKLFINGSGAMYSYTDTRAPWYEYREDIKILSIGDNVTSVSPFAFYNCGGIVKLYVGSGSTSFTTDNLSLFNSNGTELIITFARGSYEIPAAVTTVSAPAFIVSDNLALESNGNLTVKDSVIYDSQGNILAALPAYRERTLVIAKPLTVKEYAFILTEYPERLETGIISANAENYSLGYYYNGSFTKQNFTVSACAESGVGIYAVNNGFTLETGIYRCGAELTYSYDSDVNALHISGIGAMYTYQSASAVPWYGVIGSLVTLVIDDGVTYLSPYSFSNAASLKYLTMPLSVSAPQENNVWDGCENIKQLELTTGSGYMDDYATADGAMLYTYSPWFISKTSLTSLTVSSEVKYIGKQAFRGCSALLSLTLNSIEEIGEDGLLACPKLRDLTILSKDAILPDYCMLSYKAGSKKIYQGFSVSGYCDSTVKDYCDRLGAVFVSLGCGHSRSVVLNSTDNDGLTLTSYYYCNDCEESFVEITDISSSLSGTVLSTNGEPVPDATVIIGDCTAITDKDGAFALSGLTEGVKEVALSVNGVRIMTDECEINEGVNNCVITVRYADYVTDGVINAKDFAYSLRHFYDDTELFDYGKITEGDNSITVTENEN